jgi:hypothetical protein
VSWVSPTVGGAGLVSAGGGSGVAFFFDFLGISASAARTDVGAGLPLLVGRALSVLRWQERMQSGRKSVLS